MAGLNKTQLRREILKAQREQFKARLAELRGLIAAGIRALSRPGASATQQGLAGSVGIELFVLGYTLLSRPSP